MCVFPCVCELPIAKTILNFSKITNYQNPDFLKNNFSLIVHPQVTNLKSKGYVGNHSGSPMVPLCDQTTDNIPLWGTLAPTVTASRRRQGLEHLRSGVQRTTRCLSGARERPKFWVGFFSVVRVLSMECVRIVEASLAEFCNVLSGHNRFDVDVEDQLNSTMRTPRN